jgi:hypothetical protein
VRQTIEITVLLPDNTTGPYPIEADVVGGLAIHKAVRGVDFEDGTHTLTHVATGMALCDATPPVLRRVRTALLAVDVPWEGDTTTQQMWRYRHIIRDTVQAATCAGTQGIGSCGWG